MKRLFSLFLVALLLFPALAMGTAAQVATTYVNEDPYYSYVYPLGWKMINKDTVNLLMGVYANSLASSYAELIQNMGVVMFMSPDEQEFAVVLTQFLGMDIPAEMLISVLPMLVEGVKTQAPDAEIISDGELLQLGDNSFAKIVLLMPIESVNMITTIYITTANQNLYAVSYYIMGTNPDFGGFESTLASFSLSR